jgi:predicted amidohydrolase YtcJ
MIPATAGCSSPRRRQLDRAVAVATASGWQVATHAIGDAGVGATLDAYARGDRRQPGAGSAAARRARPGDDRRTTSRGWRKLGVIASMQPTHATSDMPWAEARLGPARIKGAYAWRRVLDAGALIVAGSDFPVEEVPVLRGIYAAVSRPTIAASRPAAGIPIRSSRSTRRSSRSPPRPRWPASWKITAGISRPAWWPT